MAKSSLMKLKNRSIQALKIAQRGWGYVYKQGCMHVCTCGCLYQRAQAENGCFWAKIPYKGLKKNENGLVTVKNRTM